MTQGVAESKPGTIPEVEGQAKVAPSKKGGTPEPASKVSPEETPKYTQKEADALVHAAKSETGRNVKTLESQVATLEAQAKTKDTEITDSSSEIEKLEVRVSDLTSDDPARFNAINELKAAREERRQLKADRNALEAEKLTHGETIRLAQDTLQEISIWGVAAEYEGGDPVKLKALCETLEAKSDEQMRKVADTIWAKKSSPETPPLTPYSTVTDGGSDRIGDMAPKDRLKETDRRLRLEQK